jgi:hypothetical protein
MRTVKDFREAGLVLVGNDVVDGITGDPKSLGFTINEIDENRGYTLGKGRDVWTMRQFAWREYDGVIPSFNGKVEFMPINSEVIQSVHAGLLYWGHVKKWRPLINQPVTATTETPEEKEALDKIFGADSAPIEAIAPLKFFNAMIDGYVDIMKLECKRDITGKWEVEEAKPTYTQEMANHGIKPLIGMDVYISYPKGSYDCLILGYHGDYVWFEGMGIYRTIRVDKCDFKPTARELAIADLVKVLEEAAKHGEDYAIDAAAIYDAGYRK